MPETDPENIVLRYLLQIDTRLIDCQKIYVT